MGPLLQSLGLLQFKRTDPGSSLFVELYQKIDDSYSVELRYMENYQSERHFQEYDFKSFEDKISESFSSMHEIFKDTPLMKEICKTDYIGFLNRSENSGH